MDKNKIPKKENPIDDKSMDKKEAKAEQKIDEKPAEDRQKLLEMSEISIWLDTYDDIFSDFDPRPYSQRALSDDFLNETRKASRDKPYDKLELRILIAENLRDQKNEAMIKKRLKEHFTKHTNMLRKELKSSKKKSALFGFIGVFTIFIATLIPGDNFIEKFLFVVLEPTGWFITWFALDNIFYSNNQKKAEYEFYSKMAKSEIIFSSY